MGTYVLVHGAGHGGWCWRKVVEILRREGHQVEAPDLPGHGEDKTPISQVTLKAYADRVCQVLDTQAEPVVLVGHSMGGIVISQAAEYRSDRIKTLVYLTAALLPDGQSLLQGLQGGSGTLEDALAGRDLTLSGDRTYATYADAVIRERFYGDCSDEDVAWAKSRLTRQAVEPLAAPVRTTRENFGRIPRVYIECLLDKAIPASAQKQMYTAIPCERVLSMNTSHSPFLSAPKELAGHLASL